jgi:protein SCO1/2
LALLEASEGKIGSAFERVLLYCFHYDANAGRYTLWAVHVMQVGGITTLLVLAGILIGFWFKEHRRRKEAM